MHARVELIPGGDSAQAIGGRISGGGARRPRTLAGTGETTTQDSRAGTMVTTSASGIASRAVCPAHVQVGHTGGHCLPSVSSTQLSSQSDSRPVASATIKAPAIKTTRRHTRTRLSAGSPGG